MGWFIINTILGGLAILSLGVLAIAMRKLAQTIRFGRELTYQMKLATLNLDQAVNLLRNEHKNFRNESYKLDTRIKETVRIRHDIGRSLAHMKQMHSQLQQKFNQSPTVAADESIKVPYCANSIPINTILQSQEHEKNGLPVFVQRKISKTALKSAPKP
ncbi:MAG: hypothetical protein JSC189_000310 [Candidatus Tokpelaia sp. JSC189]|nr:MAG: hypothetical protein JSC189_000310 [Candidatus Tokpelaia sp. JSC189]